VFDLPRGLGRSFPAQAGASTILLRRRALGRVLPLCALAAVLFAAIAPLKTEGQQNKVLRIAAAADLEPVLPPLMAEFQNRTGVKVQAAYASSATLATQIVNGAPFDLFLAADLSFPRKVIAAGLADSPTPSAYARGTLVLWIRNDSPVRKLNGDLAPGTPPDKMLAALLAALKSSSVRRVAVADAAHAPYGRAAMAAIDNLGLANALQPKLVVAQNIAQAAQFVESGNADVGFISLTAALTPQMQAEGTFVEVPARAYPPILQGAVVVKNQPNREEAHRFLDFLRSPSIEEQLTMRGLKTP
jgi:molybdate transport system substrate-binding protein